LRLYYAYKGGMSVGHLPFAGGLAEQPAALMAAFNHCASIEERHKEAMKAGDGGEG
jgi:hypothetical protein